MDNYSAIKPNKSGAPAGSPGTDMMRKAHFPKADNRGLTLVELVVTFALLGLFMVAAMRVISYTVNIYYAAKGINNSQVVSNMVAEKVSGLVGSMSEGTDLSLDKLGVPGGRETDKLPIVKKENDTDALYFVDDTNCPVRITVDEEGHLLVTYFDKVSVDDTSVTYKQVPWYFAEDAYMGYEIKDFKLEKAPSEYPDNVYMLEFTIHSERYGDYAAKRCIKCYSMPDTAG